MNMKIWITAIAIGTTGVAALAHSGATGVVLERMQGMSAMAKTLKTLSPMMRGQVPYDADVVRREADAMIGHAGEQMTRLFPEGSGGGVSKALPSVWDDGEEFAALAEDLRTAAEGLKLSAGNGLAAAQGNGSGSMMGGATDGMMGGATGGMMGGGSAPAMGAGMMGSEQPMAPEMFADMSADRAFAMVAQTCSACHQKFRKEDK